MEIATIKGDEVLLVYHPADESAEVGQQYKIVELTEVQDGLVVQIISNDSLDYTGLQQELIQNVLEQRLAETIKHLDREYGIGQLRSLKIATAKIRKRIKNNNWETWDGWIPTRNVDINLIEADELISNVMANSEYRIDFCEFLGTPIGIDGPSLNMVNVITGVKGSGKSHMAKHFVLGLADLGVPIIVFDMNGEYVRLPNAQVFRWGDNFRPSLADVGYDMLERLISLVFSFQSNSPSEATFSMRLPQIWAQRQRYCKQQGKPFTIDITDLINSNWGDNEFVQGAIERRLRMIQSMNLFYDQRRHANSSPHNIRTSYNIAAEQGRPIVFDMRDLRSYLQRALVRAMNDLLKEVCDEEFKKKTGRFPFIFYEEAHFYVSDDVILDIITRGRHIGMGVFFVTNTPQELPRTVFRQLDNLFLLALTHNDDIRNVSNSSFTDEATIRSFATRMPRHHGLILGNVTKRYPMVVRIKPLPDNVPTSGETRSTWTRFSDSS